MYKIGVCLSAPKLYLVFIFAPLSALHTGGAPGCVAPVQGLLRHAAPVQLRDAHVVPGAAADLQGAQPICNTALLLPTLPGIAGPRELPLMTVPLALCCVRAAHPSPCRWC